MVNTTQSFMTTPIFLFLLPKIVCVSGGSRTVLRREGLRMRTPGGGVMEYPARVRGVQGPPKNSLNIYRSNILLLKFGERFLSVVYPPLGPGSVLMPSFSLFNKYSIVTN